MAANAGVARADLVSYVTSTPITSVPINTTGGTAGAIDSNLTFQKFDTSLGTLNSVELLLSSGYTAAITVTNNRTGSTYGTTKVHISFFADDYGPIGADSPQFEKDSQIFTFATVGAPLAAGQHVTSGLLSDTGTSDITYTDQAVLDEFTGSDVFSLSAQIYDYCTMTEHGSGSGSTSRTTAGEASMTGTVIYDYTPTTPEPATMALLGLGLVGLIARRKQAAK